MTFSDDFDWDEANVGHVVRHGVEPWEAEEAVLDPYRIAFSTRKTLGERRFALVGATESGRMLFVVYTQRGAKGKADNGQGRGRRRKAPIPEEVETWQTRDSSRSTARTRSRRT